MKKNLNNFFDEATPQELDQFSDELNAPKLPDEVLGSIKNKVYVKTNLTKEKKNKRSLWLRFGVIAACLVMILGVFIFALILRENNSEILSDNDTDADVKTENLDNSDNADNTDVNLSPESTFFDSLDKVNFYGGLKVIAESTAKNMSANNINVSRALSLSYGDKNYTRVMKSTETDSRDRGTSQVTDIYTSQVKDTDNKSSYDRGWDVSRYNMTITTAIYFKINVTENDTLLALKIGTGEAEVIVTDLCIGINPHAMITFKNGDKYFSCLTEMSDLKSQENRFGSHLQIDGFKMVKNRVDEMTTFFNFVLNDDKTEIESFSWTHYNKIPSEAILHDIEFLPETVFVSYSIYKFTLKELYAYWKGKDSNAETPKRETSNAETSKSETAKGEESETESTDFPFVPVEPCDDEVMSCDLIIERITYEKNSNRTYTAR